ncbi:branched-chain amino acid ABC transporter permease [Castellaniella sp. MT123]|uniref:branched-chain amino acid ABC transporter permease n=1 Tax=Castellaniella sp. MT123 TaxID=3140381 RepID=UPI0031F37F70|nr:branched-chain amino acid ABC transporter permease [Castellaniella sp.]
MLAQQLVNALSLGCVYALFALGFTLIFGVLDVINLSHGAVFMSGSYAALYLITRLGLPPAAGLVAAFAAAGALGALIDQLVLRPLRKRGAPQLIPMIATIGIAIILTNGAQGIFGPDNQRFPHGTVPSQTLILAGVRITVVEIGIIFLSFALMALLMFMLRRTRLGRALRAVAESPKAASLLGIHVERVFLTTSFAAGGLGGIAGVLIGLYSDAIYPLMGEPMLQKGIAVVILGGLGSIPGALLGGIFLGFSEVFSVAYIGSTMRDAVAFGLLFLVLLLRPQGLFSKATQRKA